MTSGDFEGTTSKWIFFRFNFLKSLCWTFEHKSKFVWLRQKLQPSKTSNSKKPSLTSSRQHNGFVIMVSAVSWTNSCGSFSSKIFWFSLYKGRRYDHKAKQQLRADWLEGNHAFSAWQLSPSCIQRLVASLHSFEAVLSTETRRLKYPSNNWIMKNLSCPNLGFQVTMNLAGFSSRAISTWSRRETVSLTIRSRGSRTHSHEASSLSRTMIPISDTLDTHSPVVRFKILEKEPKILKWFCYNRTYQ